MNPGSSPIASGRLWYKTRVDSPLTVSVVARESAGDPYTLIEICGEADITSSGLLRSALEDAAAERPVMLLLDLRGLRFMDSSALHVILRVNRSLDREGGVLALVAPGEAVARTLSLTAADQTIPVYASVAEAVAGLTGPGNPGGSPRLAGRLPGYDDLWWCLRRRQHVPRSSRRACSRGHRIFPPGLLRPAVTASPHGEESVVKIAMVAQHAAPVPGGAGRSGDEAWLRSLGRALADRGHEVTVYAGKPDPELPDEAELCPGVRVEYHGAPARDSGRADELAGVPGFCRVLRARWRRERPDVAHALRWTSGLAAVAAAHDEGIPVVQRFASVRLPEQPNGSGSRPRVNELERHRAERAIGRSAAAVLAASSAEEAFLTRLGVPRRSVHVVPCGVDTAEFAPEGPMASRNGRPRLLTVTELTDRGLGTLLRAFARVPGAELVVAAGPPRDRLPRDRAFRDAVALAGSLGVTDRVHFTGQVGRCEWPALLRSAELLISVPEHEPPSTLCVEAMACGTPVVATPVGIQADAVIDGTTGILVPPGQPGLLARRIRELLARPMRIEAFSMAGAERARFRYSWDRVTGEILTIYDSVRPGAAVAA